MCQICKNLIYDIIISPISHDHPLYIHINYKALNACIVDVVDCFYRAVRDFPIFPEFFFKPVNPIQPPTHGSPMSLRISIPNPETIKSDSEEWLWTKFHIECAAWAHELEYAIDTCVEKGVARNTQAKEQLIKQFFMEKLKIILVNLPTIHNEHTMKILKVEKVSPGPVSLWDLIHIRQKVGLSVRHLLPKNVYHYP